MPRRGYHPFMIVQIFGIVSRRGDLKYSVAHRYVSRHGAVGINVSVSILQGVDLNSANEGGSSKLALKQLYHSLHSFLY